MLDLLRLNELLGLTLDELRNVIAAEGARGALRAEWHEGDPSPTRRREILEETQVLIAHQLTLLRRRREKLDELERELVAKREQLELRLLEHRTG